MSCRRCSGRKRSCASQRAARARRLDRLGIRFERRPASPARARTSASSAPRRRRRCRPDARSAQRRVGGASSTIEGDKGARRARPVKVDPLDGRAGRALDRRSAPGAIPPRLRRRHPALARPRQHRGVAALGQHRGADRASARRRRRARPRRAGRGCRGRPGRDRGGLRRSSAPPRNAPEARPSASSCSMPSARRERRRAGAGAAAAAGRRGRAAPRSPGRRRRWRRSPR